MEKIRTMYIIQCLVTMLRGKILVFMLSAPPLVTFNFLTVPMSIYQKDYGKGKLCFLSDIEYKNSGKSWREVLVFNLGFGISNLSKAEPRLNC